uniref:Uncharacterized protein n=1 Tax=Timema cristinae TaxID=61476 RepID=A0A7R9H518_TIMCR|nr:unnamed protein product [Timema cristinae]
MLYYTGRTRRLGCNKEGEGNRGTRPRRLLSRGAVRSGNFRDEEARAITGLAKTTQRRAIDPPAGVNRQITRYIVIPSDGNSTTHTSSMASNIQQPCVILIHKLADLEFHQPGRSIGRTVLARQQDASYRSYMLFSTGTNPILLTSKEMYKRGLKSCQNKP